MYYTIYKVTNKINGKIYIGSHKTKNLNDNYMGSGKYLRYSINKHGIEKFNKEILHIFDNAKEMYDKEAELVNEEFIAESNTYNLKIGGFGGFDYINSHKLNTSISDSSRIKLSKLQKSRMKNNLTYKTAISNLWKGNHVAGFKDKQHTKETKSKIGAASAVHQKGKKNSQYGTCWIHNNKVSKKINKDDLNKYLAESWIEGRKIKFKGA